MPNTIRIKRGTTEPTAGVLVTGELAIDTTNGDLYSKLDDGSVTKVVAKASNLNVSVRNETGSPIPAMSAVYISGASSNKALVSLSQANAESTSSKTLGLTTAAISDSNNGEVVAFGTLSKVDTSAYAAGDALWLSPTVAGGVTTTKPSAPNHMVFIGTVVRSHATQGVIEVRVANGFELEELHNISITTPTDGQVLKYEASTGLWKNAADTNTGTWGSISGTLSNQTDLQNALDAKANLSGATFTGKVDTNSTVTTAGLKIGVSTTAPTTTVAGDIWVGTNNLFFKDSVNVQRAVLNNNTVNTFTANQIISGSSTSAMLRITQTGTGQSLVVEDEANPDVHAFVVNPSGMVGIQRDPATWSPAAGVVLDVNGKGVFTTTAAYAGLNAGTVTATPTTLSNGDIWIGSALNFRDNAGNNRACVVTNTANTISSSTTVNPLLTVTQNSTTGSIGALTVNNASLGTGVIITHTNASATGPAVRITNTSGGHTLVFEDDTNPDTNSFFINNVGRVGIGLDPATASLTVPLTVNGSIIGTTESTGDSSTKVATTAYVQNNLANYTTTANLNNTAVKTTVTTEYGDVTATVATANTITKLDTIGATSHTITLPDNATEAIPIGSQFVFVNQDGYTTSFAAGGIATVNSRGSLVTMNGQYSVATAIKTGTNEWVITGDLA